jgi:hypothetical protein
MSVCMIAAYSRAVGAMLGFPNGFDNLNGSYLLATVTVVVAFSLDYTLPGELLGFHSSSSFLLYHGRDVEIQYPPL